MKPYLQVAAVLTALAAGLAVAAFSWSVVIPSPWLQFPVLIAGLALPLGLLWRLYWPFDSMIPVAAVVSTLVVTVFLGQLLSGYLLDVRGEPQTATVTEYLGTGAKSSGHYVRLADADGDELRDSVRVTEAYAPGANVEILVDPGGWAPPAAADGSRPGGWFPWTAGAAVALLAGLYVLVVRRETGKSPG